MSTLFPVVIASGFHLFPFRTEKLSPTAPMVLRKRESRSPPSYFKRKPFQQDCWEGFSFFLCQGNAALFRRVCGVLPLHSRRCFIASATLFVLPVWAWYPSRCATLCIVQPFVLLGSVDYAVASTIEEDWWNIVI